MRTRKIRNFELQDYITVKITRQQTRILEVSFSHSTKIRKKRSPCNLSPQKSLKMALCVDNLKTAKTEICLGSVQSVVRTKTGTQTHVAIAECHCLMSCEKGALFTKGTIYQIPSPYLITNG